MATLYAKENSPQKSAARSLAYARVPRKDFWTGKHIVIASTVCGDIRYLKGLGVRPRNIIACDVDPVARAHAALLGARTDCGITIEEVVGNTLLLDQEKIVSINVDLCNTLEGGLPVLLHVLDTCCQADYRGQVFFTFTRGHSPGTRGLARDNLAREVASRLSRGQKIGTQFSNKYRFLTSNDTYDYVSHTATTVGSPMTTVMLPHQNRYLPT